VHTRLRPEQVTVRSAVPLLGHAVRLGASANDPIQTVCDGQTLGLGLEIRFAFVMGDAEIR
jgi:hypothetical protein